MTRSATPTSPSLPLPANLGLPPKFASWRPYQEPTLHEALAASERFIGINAPTGSGKSILAEVIAQFSPGRTCYLVVNKPLQDQISGDFSYRYDVRGKSNYPCHLLEEHGLFGIAATCEKAEGLCDSCKFRSRGCDYFDRVLAAQKARHVITNYDMLLAARDYREGGLGEFDLLIMDEAHEALEKLSSYLRIELRAETVAKFTRQPAPSAQAMGKWREWAGEQAREAKVKLDGLQSSIAAGLVARSREITELQRFARELERLAVASDDWVEDRGGELGSIGFEPVNVAPYAYRLFGGFPKVLMMSAVLRDKHFADLGIPASDYRLIEVPSSFEVVRRPIIHLRTVQQRETMSDNARIQAVERADQIIHACQGYKGLVHTVSYDRAQFIDLHSKSPGLILHASKDTARIVKAFRDMQPPAILASPAIMTGYNFPYDDARFQIIYKVPFEYGGGPIAKARAKRDPDYGKFKAWVKLMQALGRINRAVDDWGVSFIIDNAFADWFWYECLRKGWVPGYLRPAVTLNGAIPRMPIR